MLIIRWHKMSNFEVQMEVKPAISADSVSQTIPKISLTTTTLTSCSTMAINTITTIASSMAIQLNNNNNNNSDTNALTTCGLCYQPIYDQYIMRVVDISYHERCLQCCSCSKRLMHSCFARNGKLYCRYDYER